MHVYYSPKKKTNACAFFTAPGYINPFYCAHSHERKKSGCACTEPSYTNTFSEGNKLFLEITLFRLQRCEEKILGSRAILLHYRGSFLRLSSFAHSPAMPASELIAGAVKNYYILVVGAGKKIIMQFLHI